MSEPTPPLLRVDGLRVTVESDGVSREAVRGVSFEVAAGEVLGIVGESGSGKSLTAASITALLPARARRIAGTITFKGEDISTAPRRRLTAIRGQQIAMVFQDSLTSLNPVKRIGDQVREPLLVHQLAPRQVADEAAEAGLSMMGIPDAHHAVRRYPHEFSGGMRQRAMIASAMIAKPSLIIADEPTTALDVTVQAQILDLWRRLVRDSNVALIVISHDLGVISELATTLAVMYAGRIQELGPTRDLLARPQHPYTRALLEAMPRASVAGRGELVAISGEPPRLDARPPGCPFHPRCPVAEARCRIEEPDLMPVVHWTSACWVAQEARLAAPGMGRGGQSAGAAAVTPDRAGWLAGAGVIRDPALAGHTTRGSDRDEPLLRVEAVTKHYASGGGILSRQRQVVHALDDVSLQVRKGETLGIVGESGCGKSTLARCILRLSDVDAGAIVFRGTDITRMRGKPMRQMRRYMQPIFQDPYSSLNPRTRIGRAVAEPLLAHGIAKRDADRRVDEVLEYVALGSHYRDRLPHNLSGGERQRVGIARALALDTELLVADEPISALDVSIQAQILNLIKDLQRRLGLTILFISHDLRIVEHMSTRIVILHLGKVVEMGPAISIAERPRHPYTAALLSAVPVVGGSGDGRIVLTGDPPSPVHPPSGCRFRTRCPRAQALCAEVEPALEAATDHAWACHFPIEEP